MGDGCARDWGAGTSIGGKKMSLHEKGDQTRALNHNSDFSARFRVDFPNSQTFANFTSEICRRGLLAGRGCPKCGYRAAGKLTSERKRLDSQTFKNRIAEKSPSLELLSDYKCAKEKIKTRCRKCGYTWMASPISLNAGSLCPACANHVVFRGHNDLGTVTRIFQLNGTR